MKNFSAQIVCMLACGLMLAGCASKEPQIITRTVYQEVKTPVACIERERLPTPPKYDPSVPDTFVQLMQYAVAVDKLLKGCAVSSPTVATVAAEWRLDERD